MFGTKKEVREWNIIGKGAGYFRITDYELLQMDWELAYIVLCVKAAETTVLEDGRKFKAALNVYSQLNINMDMVFSEVEKHYITPSITDKEKQKRRHGISAQFLIMKYTTAGLTFINSKSMITT